MFYESFDKNNGTGGNDGKFTGSIASANANYDNTGWIDPNVKGANKCVKIGSKDDKGSIKTPTIKVTTKCLLSFKAAAWYNEKEKQQINVSINDNILTISGVLNSGEDDKATQWHIQECYWGEFSRTIALPVQVKETGVEAILKDGVLTISFEKEKVAAPTRIQIN